MSLPAMALQLFAIGVLLAVAWPLARPIASPSFRVAFMREAPPLVAVLGVYVLVVIGVAVGLPSLLAPLAVGAACGFAALRWHARVARGARRGWPPGRLELPSFAVWLQRSFLRRQHERYGSPFKLSQFVRPTAGIVGIPEAVDFIETHDAALSLPPLWFGRFIPRGLFRHMDRVSHDVYRNLFRAAFARDVFGPLQPFMAERMHRELARMAGDSAASGAHGVPPRRYVQRMMFAMWARLFFDVGEDRPEFARLDALYRVIDLRNPRRSSDAAIRAALDEIVAVVQGVAVAATESRGVLASFARRHPEAVGDRTVLGNMIYEMHITWADVSGLLTWLFRMLTDHPEYVRRLRAASPEDAAGTPLAARIVLETLRLEQVEHLYRATERAIPHGGRVIPEGWLVRICLAESHRDPEVFVNPDTFDPDRFRDHAYTKREFLPFGTGNHACIGEPLTRAVAQLFVEELARGWDWRTVADGPLEQGSFRHWRPSSRWCVLIAPRT